MAWATPIGPASSNTEEALAVTLPRLRETGRSGEQAAEVLEAYLEPRRLAAVDDELLPFDLGAVTVLRTVSEGRICILLTMAHGLVQAAATAGVPVITTDFAVSHFTGKGVDVESDGDGEGAATSGDLDDLLLS